MKQKYFVFDLDDTLASEQEYLRSAYWAIAKLLNEKNQQACYNKMLDLYNRGVDVFGEMVSQFPKYTKDGLLQQYRNHFPRLHLKAGAEEVLRWCQKENCKLGLITDGRSVTQRNKLKALGIESYFDKIIISEEFGSAKPDERNFLTFMKADDVTYYYVGDNPQKDFIGPNILGWTSICLLDEGANIHPQNFNIPPAYLPQIKIHALTELMHIL